MGAPGRQGRSLRPDGGVLAEQVQVSQTRDRAAVDADDGHRSSEEAEHAELQERRGP